VENNNANAIRATADLGIAYRQASGATCQTILPSFDLSGLVLGPGVYCSASGFFVISASTLTLKGNSSSQWVFQTSTTLITSTATSFILQDGALVMVLFHIYSIISVLIISISQQSWLICQNCHN
jgi:hypothetical protein